MNIGKQRRFSEPFRPALIIVGLIWLSMNSAFAADELAAPSQGPAALQDEPVTGEASEAEQIPAIFQDAAPSEVSDAEQIPSALQESAGSEASTVSSDSVTDASTELNPAPVASETSASPAVPAVNPAPADASVPATNVNQEIMTRPDFVDPKVTRNDIHVAAIDNENFEFGLFLGMLSTEDFGTSPVYGLKLAYHINEAVFFEVATGISTTQRTSAEDILNVDFISEAERELTYYNLSFGYNALPSETYFSDKWAFHSAIYIIGGAGFTEFAGDSFFTLNFGVGYRFLATDWLALHLDVRDHLFEMDLLGEKKTTQNIELSTSVNFFF